MAFAYDAITGCGERVERLVVGAAHDRELAVLGTGLATRHRRVDEADAELGAASASSLATSAEAVVWSTSTAPASAPASAPSGP